MRDLINVIELNTAYRPKSGFCPLDVCIPLIDLRRISFYLKNVDSVPKIIIYSYFVISNLYDLLLQNIKEHIF